MQLSTVWIANFSGDTLSLGKPRLSVSSRTSVGFNMPPAVTLKVRRPELLNPAPLLASSKLSTGVLGAPNNVCDYMLRRTLKIEVIRPELYDNGSLLGAPNRRYSDFSY